MSLTIHARAKSDLTQKLNGAGLEHTKYDFRASRENLHVVERWTRTGPATLEYVVTIEDPTVWTLPWSTKQEFTKQSDQENRIFYEPRCVEGNMGFWSSIR